MADFNSKYTGQQVEALLDIVSQGGGGGQGGGSGEEKIISARIDYISGEYLINFADSLMQPNAVYVAEGTVNGIQNVALATPEDIYAEYSLHFTTDENAIGVFAFPEYLIWANGKIPTIEAGTSYELSVVATKLADEYIYKAVLTPFKGM